MVPLLGRQQRQARSVDVDAVQVRLVDEAVGLPPPGLEEDVTRFLVHVEDLLHHPGPGGELSPDAAVGAEQVQVGPAVPLRPPEHVAVAEHVPRRGIEPAPVSHLDVGLAGLVGEHP